MIGRVLCIESCRESFKAFSEHHVVVMLLLRNFIDFFPVAWFFIYSQLLPIEDLPILLGKYDEMRGCSVN